MRLPRNLRRRFYYSIPVAGAQVGWSRSEAYRAAERGDIPTEKDGWLSLVPRRKWDRIVRRISRRETRMSDPVAELGKSLGP